MTAPGITAAWQALFNRIADGVQSEDDERQLLELLGRSPEARREFREFIVGLCGTRPACDAAKQPG